MRGEVGVFEDLQTLMVIVVGIGILLTSTLYNWSAFGSAEAKQDMHDEVEHLIDSVEAWDLLMAQNADGSNYPEFQLSQGGLEAMSDKDFQERIRSDYDYNIEFDNLTVAVGDPGSANDKYSHYQFGKPIPEDRETVVGKVQYTVVYEGTGEGQEGDASVRYPYIMTVVVWQ